MNGLQNLTDKIRGDATAYADELAESTRKKVEQTLLEHTRQADELRHELEENACREAESIVARARSQAALEERNALLRAKRELIDETFSAACDQLANLPREKYLDLLVRLIAKYRTGPAEIILNDRDLKELGKDLLKKAGGKEVTLSDQPGAFKGGLILRQGDVDTNCTFEVLCDGLRHDLEPKVIELLQF